MVARINRNIMEFKVDLILKILLSYPGINRNIMEFKVESQMSKVSAISELIET